MENIYAVFENYSSSTGVGAVVLDVSGETRFKSCVREASEPYLRMLDNALDCGEAVRVSLLYGCYQARRFGGRYIFLSPSGFFYCASPLFDERCETERDIAGVVAGPFLMSDYDEYMEIDISVRRNITKQHIGEIRRGITVVPVKTPAQALAASELLFVCASYFSHFHVNVPKPVVQAGAQSALYSIEKEDMLLAAISIGDIETANSVLNDILGQILFHYGGDIEVLRSRVVELTVLLSRAALRGGAHPDTILGMNYGYLREIDALSSVDDIVLWLHKTTSRFSQYVFDFAKVKHVDVIYRAISYIKKNYAGKITLKDISGHVFLSPSYFCTIFKEETGQTPGGYITGVRVEESKRLLRDLSISLVDIPELAGFESQSYFNKIFKRYEKCSPGEYRRNYGIKKL